MISNEKKIDLILFFWCLLCLKCLNGAASPVHLMEEGDIIKTVKTKDEDIFDCVDVYRQPAFTHPLLKDHKLQVRPTSIPKAIPSTNLRENVSSNVALEGEGCPEGSVPVHRLSSNESHSMANQGLRSNDKNIKYDRRMWAARGIKRGAWVGGGAFINVYAVQRVDRHQESSSQIYVHNPDVSALLSAGWTANPPLLNDSKTRLFIWFSNNGEQTICYNLKCAGFVQINSRVYLGSTIWPLSQYMGRQYGIRVYIFKDMVTNNWWFSLHTPENYVGYWPSRLFNNFDHGMYIKYGGYVGCGISDLCPPMGNGHLPANNPKPKGWFTSCFFKEAQYARGGWSRRLSQSMVGATHWDVYHDVSNPNCYGVGPFFDESSGFSFGGSGC